MTYDKRAVLPEGFSFTITDDNTGNQLSVTIEREIGRGGSCIAYLGTENHKIGVAAPEQITVIIKEFYPRELDENLERAENQTLKIDDSVLANFEKRKANFCNGQSKHIVFSSRNSTHSLPPVHFSGNALGTFYAVAYQGQGETLSSFDRRRLTLASALELIASICDAVSAVHGDHTRLFLDCKPDNIFVYDNRAYLFDFDTTQYYGNIKYSSYSAGWSAPEQKIVSGRGYADNKLIGFHTDVYSTAAVAYYILTGKEPLDYAEDFSSTVGNADWKSIIDVSDADSALEDDILVKELSRIFSSALNPEALERKQFYGDNSAAVRLKNEFLHLKELAENAPYRSGFKDTKEEIGRAQVAIEQVVKRNSISQVLFGNKKKMAFTITGFLLFAVLLGTIVFFTGRVANTVLLSNESVISRDLNDHVLLKLSNANHQYETGIENWRRLDYNRAERDILAARTSISDEISQAEIEVAKVNNSLGCLYLDMGRYEEAYDYLNNAYITFRDTYGDDSVESLATLFAIAQHDYFIGDSDTALKTLQQIIDKTSEDNKVVLSSIMHFQALIYDETGDYESAVAVFEDVLYLYNDILEDGKLTQNLANYANDPQLSQDEKDEYTTAVKWVALTLNNLGKTYIHAGNYNEAEDVLQKGLDMCLENIYIGKKNLTTSKLYMNLAILYSEQGKLKEAIDAIDLAMRIQRNLFDFKDVYPGLVEVYDVYGSLLQEKGNDEEAKQYFEDAVSLAISSFGENHPMTAEAFNSLGEYYYATGDYTEANKSFETAIEIRRNILGYHNPYTARYLYNLALSLFRQVDEENAKQQIASAYDLCQELSLKGKPADDIEHLYQELE